ncbi:hypothetical protein EDEG_00909 [Edhazardia aedis USNM 41457]|uniref:Sec1 family protein n=1 Tax=Edhazardia aedis (strain USNM 41457) TaxID=1003232 RepID=J9DUL7_EDHAE|nr:hypothetical protein EDEG_00909 [Edhazardia aedis USNM 41457]|eukprot:EJW04992.1 hypothetical protein EDEG_00909 [Edhazardia aedis USNM 41457]
MDLKSSAQQAIINEVLKHGHSTKTWRVLVIHERTAEILTNLFKTSELLSHEILKIQRIESKDRLSIPDHPAIYFIQPDDFLIDEIVKDHKDKKYSRYTLITVEELTKNQFKKIDKLVDPPITYNYLPLNFICFDKNVFFCDFKNIHHVAKTINIFFNIHCLKEVDRAKCIEIDNIFEKEKQERRGDIIYFDRSYDLFTPLVKFYTFQALLNDFKIIDNNFCEDKNMDFSDQKLWKKIKYMHIAEINSVLSEEAALLNANMRKIQNADTKDLIKLVLEAPEQIQLKKEVSVFLGLLDQCITRFEKQNLNTYSITQQNLILKKDENGHRYSPTSSEFFGLINDDRIILEDKIRLWMLFILCGFEFTEKEYISMVKTGILQKDYSKLLSKLRTLKPQAIYYQHSSSNYAISRYKPLLYYIISNFLKNKKGINFIRITKDVQSVISSLRKSTFVFKKELASRNKRNIFVYINGGITYAEIESAHALEKEFGVSILLGSSKIIDSENFLDYINKSSL